MQVLADTHVHLYECYDLNKVFRAAFNNLGSLKTHEGISRDAALALFLSERQGCNFFEQLMSGRLRPSGQNYSIEQSSEKNVLIVSDREGGQLYLIAGRQIVSRERLEVLALTADLNIPDGGNIHDLIRQIIAGGGVPVLPWAPGKWFGDRGEIVLSVFDSIPSHQLLVGDTSMRPLGWGEPAIMRYAERKGVKILAGTDPLPFAGQEDVVGSYGTLLEADLDLNNHDAFRRLIQDSHVCRVGRRGSPVSVFARMLRNYAVKKV